MSAVQDGTGESSRLSKRAGTFGELVDIEMSSDSPVKTSTRIAPLQQDRSVPLKEAEKENEGMKAGEPVEGTESTKASSVLRPISLNGVKKELRRRIKTQTSKSVVVHGQPSLAEDQEGDTTVNQSQSESEDDTDADHTAAISSVKRRSTKQKKQSQKGRVSYTLNMFNQPHPSGETTASHVTPWSTGASAPTARGWKDAELPYVFIG